MDIALPTKVVEKVLKQYGLDAAGALKKLEEYTEERRAVATRDEKVRRLQADSEKKIAELLAKKLCRHAETEEHGDPSGNGDHETQCLICGAWL